MTEWEVKKLIRESDEPKGSCLGTLMWLANAAGLIWILVKILGRIENLQHRVDYLESLWLW